MTDTVMDAVIEDDAPGQYIRANYEREDWLAVVLIRRNPVVVKQEFATAERISSPAYLARLQAANARGADVYLGVNSFKPGSTTRTKADVEAVRHVYLDLDGGGREAVDRITGSPGIPAPHHILHTSPGKHQLIWSVTGFDRDGAEELVRSLAARHGTERIQPFGMWPGCCGFQDSATTNTKRSGTWWKTGRLNRLPCVTTGRRTFPGFRIVPSAVNKGSESHRSILTSQSPAPAIRKASGTGPRS